MYILVKYQYVSIDVNSNLIKFPYVSCQTESLQGFSQLLYGDYSFFDFSGRGLDS